MRPIRVGIVSDLAEEGWHSMDLVADMLIDCLPRVAGARIHAERLCVPMVKRWSRLPVIGAGAHARLGDRLTGRLWDYPRWLAARAAEFDVFHIVDHSYAHLVRVLPPDKTIVTCHDIDAIRLALPDSGSVLHPGRLLASHVLDGLCRAAHIACVTDATREELLTAADVRPARVSVVHGGVHPSCRATADVAAGSQTRGSRTLLHVGSTISRKRIDLLLEIVAGVRQTIPDVRLVRVGGALTREQAQLARQLNVAEATTEMPFLSRGELADLYRQSSILLLPSDREGFGLPLVEAMACGTPAVASSIPALREVGGAAAVYCEPGRAGEWVEAIEALLLEEARNPERWRQRRVRCIEWASAFTWERYAEEMADLYERYARASLASRSVAS